MRSGFARTGPIHFMAARLGGIGRSLINLLFSPLLWSIYLIQKCKSIVGDENYQENFHVGLLHLNFSVIIDMHYLYALVT
ncbi:hypothetical protein ABEB36_004135 [Hypothenemus hampei]|uniref:Uncharacterized protein n=1 Tax=Hypothenemus hampei TaxID=57062 RepID=A0ABD1F2A2_HYPHA